MKWNIGIKIILLTLFICIGVCGCMTNTEAKKSQKVLDYLEKKYNEKFVLINMYEDNYDIPYKEYVLYPEKDASKKFSVYEADKGYSDNYYGILVQGEYQKILEEVIGTIIFDAKIYFEFTSSYYDEDLNQNVDLEIAIERDKKQFFSNVWIFTNGKRELSEQEFNNICDIFLERKMTLYVAYYEISEEDYLEMNKENYTDYLQENYEVSPIYRKTIK